MKKVLAIDVGGTKISYSIINENGEFLDEVNKTSTPKDINELINIFKEVISNNENKVDMISFATAGAVNIENTKVDSSTPNLPKGYNDIDFSKLSQNPYTLKMMLTQQLGQNIKLVPLLEIEIQL